MKTVVLMERFPYRFCETAERGWVEKFSHDTKRYSRIYEVADERQMAVLLEDPEYVKYLDGQPAYVRSRIVAPYK